MSDRATSPGRPDVLPANPGQAASGDFSFTDGVETWSETIHLAELLRDVGIGLHEELEVDHAWVIHKASGLTMLPLLANYYPIESGGYQSLTTIQVHHPTLIPDGIFEFQHSTGNSLTHSLAQGFHVWLQTDFVSLMDATREKPGQCTFLEMAFPPEGDQPKRVRRAILGPVAHYSQRPQPADPNDEHPFCPCCLLTRSFAAFQDLIKGSGTYGIRFFAARDEAGQAQADCRINGEDYEAGAVALREYAATWPKAGYEFRKQYVILRSMHDASVELAEQDGTDSAAS